MTENSLKPALRYFLLLIVAAIWGYGIYSLSISEPKQWDFKTYYYGAIAHDRALNWWDPVVLSGVARADIKLAYVYPPLTVWFFKPLTWLDFSAAYQVWLFVKVLLLALLVFLWCKAFLKDEDPAIVLLFATLAYGSSAYWDLVAGNIGIFEQAVLWLGLYGLLKHRLWLFTACVLLISLFKLTFIIFLALPLLLRDRTALRFALVGSALFVGYLLLNYLTYAHEFSVFWSIITSIDERGEVYNHSLLAFCRDLIDIFRGTGTVAGNTTLGSAIYVVLAAVILWQSWLAWRRQKPGDSHDDFLTSLALFTLTYALIMPRMKTYSFVLLIPASLLVMRRYLTPQNFVFLFILLSLTKWTPLPFPDSARLLWWYYPWLTALLIWVLLIVGLRRGHLLDTAKTTP